MHFYSIRACTRIKQTRMLTSGITDNRLGGGGGGGLLQGNAGGRALGIGMFSGFTILVAVEGG